MTNWNTLSVLIYLFLGICQSNALFEDQIGKFDWHQKYFGRIEFILNDLNQPKRIIVGTKDNIVGAVNSNTGAILYRHVFESNTKLLHLGNWGEKQILGISCSGKHTKLRTFATSTGILKDELSLKQSADYATGYNGVLYFINLVGELSFKLSITSYDFSPADSINDPDGDNTEFGNGEKRDCKIRKTDIVGLDLERVDFCKIVSPYVICVNGREIRTIKLDESGAYNIVRSRISEGEVLQISGTILNQIPVVTFKGATFTKIVQFRITESGLEMIPIPFPHSAHSVTISQAPSDGKTILFITHVENPRLIRIDAFSTDGSAFVKEDSLSLSVVSKNLILALDLAKVYCHNSQCGLIGFTKDELFFGTKLESEVSTVQVTWTRQECLASVLAVETVDYPSEAEQSWNPYASQQGLLKSFISRIKYEIDTLISGDRFYTSNEDRFGVKKVIVFVTASGKVLGMDGVSGQILYTFSLPEFSTFSKPSSVFLYIQRPAKYAPLKPLASILYPKIQSTSTILFPFNPVEGQHLDEPQKYPRIIQAQMLLHGTETTNFLKPILLVDNYHLVHTYPPRITDIHNLYFTIANKLANEASVKGFAVVEDKPTQTLLAKKLWELNFGNVDLLGVHGKLPCEKIHSQGRVLPDRSVSYKYMNPNLVAIVTADPDAGNINVILVDGVSGGVIHSFWHKKSRGPVHVVHSEHWLVYTLFNEKFRRYELTSVELYEGQQQRNSSTFSSFTAPPIQPLIIKQSYIFPSMISFMSYTRTEKGITNKDILIALPSGGILELPRYVMVPRLSAQHHNIHQDEDGVIHSVPYIPELPLPSDMIINYNQSVKRVHGIKTWPTRLESTCLVLVYGSDIFYTKVSPSKQFDVLKDDFDHWFISLVLGALVIGAYVTKRFSAKKQLEQAWR